VYGLEIRDLRGLSDLSTRLDAYRNHYLQIMGVGNTFAKQIVNRITDCPKLHSEAASVWAVRADAIFRHYLKEL